MLVLATSILAIGCGDDGSASGSTGTTADDGINLTEGMEGGSGSKLDVAMGTGGGGCVDIDQGCGDHIDLLFVIDNSGSMAEEQLNLAKNMPLLTDRLENLTDSMGLPVDSDVNIMVTTTDMGNELCTPYYKPGRSPEEGSPITTPCTERIDRFTGVGQNPIDASAVCDEACPNPIAPEGQFIHFAPEGSNVPDAPEVDVNGDGMPDSNVAQALACIGPQGIDGCGYESPLDAMRNALDPGAAWNSGDDPFLRPGGVLAVAIITDEADCSIADASVMSDEQFMENHPDTGMPVPTSAICWNAGVTCEGPDGNGVYATCSSSGEKLVAVQEYIDLLKGQGRPVVMLGILGVPPVTERNPDPPYEPIAGGVMDLVYRDWRDPDWDNGGDILPDQWADGIDATYKQYEFGVGPGCTGEDGMGAFTGQAIPPVRVKEVCEALNTDMEIRCCIESICDTDFSNAIRCMTGLIQENINPTE